MYTLGENEVLADGVWRDPYEDSDIVVTSLDATGIVRNHARWVSATNSRCSGDDRALSRLGIANVALRTVSITIRLRTKYYGHPTLTGSDLVTISLSHRDCEDDLAKTATFDAAEREGGTLDFAEIVTLARQVPKGHGHIDILDAVFQIQEDISSQHARVEAFETWLRLQSTLKLLEKPLKGPAKTGFVPPTTLLTAWHQHARDRHDHMRYRVENTLHQIDTELEVIPRALLDQGVTWETMRERMHHIYNSLFQLRLIAQAYYKGVWE